MQVTELKPEWLVEIAPHYYQLKDVEDRKFLSVLCFIGYQKSHYHFWLIRNAPLYLENRSSIPWIRWQLLSCSPFCFQISPLNFFGFKFSNHFLFISEYFLVNSWTALCIISSSKTLLQSLQYKIHTCLVVFMAVMFSMQLINYVIQSVSCQLFMFFVAAGSKKFPTGQGRAL